MYAIISINIPPIKFHHQWKMTVITIYDYDLKKNVHIETIFPNIAFSSTVLYALMLTVQFI